MPKTCAREPTARCHAGLTAQMATVVRRDRGQIEIVVKRDGGGALGWSSSTGLNWRHERVVKRDLVTLDSQSGQKGLCSIQAVVQTRDGHEAVKMDIGQTGKWWNRACDDAGQWSKGAADGILR